MGQHEPLSTANCARTWLYIFDVLKTFDHNHQPTKTFHTEYFIHGLLPNYSQHLRRTWTYYFANLWMQSLHCRLMFHREINHISSTESSLCFYTFFQLLSNYVFTHCSYFIMRNKTFMSNYAQFQSLSKFDPYLTRITNSKI